MRDSDTDLGEGLYELNLFLALGYGDVVAEQRAKVTEAWLRQQEAAERLEAGVRLLDQTIRERNEALREFRDLHSDFRHLPGAGGGQVMGAEWIFQRPDGHYWISEDMIRRMRGELASAGRELHEARGKLLFGAGARARAAQHLDNYARLMAALTNRRSRMQRELEDVRADRQRVEQIRVEAQRKLDAVLEEAAETGRNLPAVLQPWTAPVWESDWTGQIGLDLGQIYLGRNRPVPLPRLGEYAGFGTEYSGPFVVNGGGNLHLAHTAGDRAAVQALVRSMLLRTLVATGPGDLRMTFFDPIGLGQSAATLLELAEYDAELIGGKVWSSTADLTSRLAEHTAHIELVIQKYLRSTYESIEDYNAAAGEVAEPYRYLVIFDFPSGFTEETSRELVRILENGARCGVRVLLVSHLGLEIPYGVDVRAVDAVCRPAQLVGVHHDFTLEMDSDQAAPPGLIHTIIDHVGRAVAGRAESTVTFGGVFDLFREAAVRGVAAGLPRAAAAVDAADPGTWWAGSTAEAAVAPIGRAGAREVATLAFDSGAHAGALLVGRPGSGKSTLLHSYLAGLTTLYGPEELELYLIDFKEGVEFQVYARESLPHARCVAIESDREFGLSVLQSLADELKDRGELLRSTGGRHSGLTALRRATGQVLPRVLLVFDEFHVLFARNDKIGQAAAALLETLVRQGRSFGIHLLLGSQSLAGLDALGSHVPQLLPVRILLPAAEADARRVLGEGNDAGQYLTRHGEGVLNTAGGAVEANQRFRGAFQDEQERRERVVQLRAMADARGFTRRPIVFEGNAATPIESIPPARFREELTVTGRAPLRLRPGAPMTIGGLADLELKREPGANVLVVARADTGVPESQLALAVASFALSPARIDVIDFMSIDEGVDVLAPLVERGRLRVHRRRALAPLLGELRELVRERVATDDVAGPARTLLLYGLHRARDLDVLGGIDADPQLLDAIEEIVRDGPEVGVHTWAWCETAAGLQRRLPGSVVREFAWRVAGRQSADDSQRILGTEEAADLRDRQILTVNDDRRVSRRCTSYTVPSGAWLADLFPSVTE